LQSLPDHVRARWFCAPFVPIAELTDGWWAERMSAQSLERAVEDERAVIGGNLSDSDDDSRCCFLLPGAGKARTGCVSDQRAVRESNGDRCERRGRVREGGEDQTWNKT
jgi:hypothetical protein